MEHSEVIIAIITALVGIIGFFVKRAFDRLDDKADKSELDEVKKSVTENTNDIRRIKDKYLTKEDYLFEQAKVEKRLDRIMEILIEMSKGGSS